MKHNRILIFFSLLAVAIAGCKKDNKSDPGTENKEVNYVFANVGGVSPSITTYIQGVTDLNFTNLTNANSAEMPAFGAMTTYKQSVFIISSGAPATLRKFTFDDKGNTVLAGKLVVPGANTFSSIEFLNDSTAFASVGGGLARVVIFNPTLLQITGEVNLTPILKAGAASTYYLGMKSRDGKLFMGVHYFNSSFEPLYDSAYVAVIDIAAKKVDKLISDGRTCAIFQAGTSVNGFEMDSNGDIYIQALGSTSVPSGVLRIRNGETGFDPSYFFDLKATTGQDCRNLWHFGPGLTFTTRISNPADPYETGGPNYEFYRIDLAARTSAGKVGTLPAIYGSSTSIIRKFNDQELMMVVASATENAVYSYNISNSSLTKKFTLPGTRCTGFTKIK